ncbi:polyprenyl synthetase family protein [Candidatus Daviesbacteria bacterium]|nr:polyprenyl synthetase family protein [Candidatus Daviesbacteria bacterium]
MEVDFADYLKINAQKIDLELDRLLALFLAEAEKISPKLSPKVCAFIDSCKGGKRIRGVLCKLGYELASSKFKVQSSKWDKEILKIAAALEIMHAAILVHDDIIDKSPFRRGKPSLYIKVGVDQAITLGDLGFFVSLQIISQTSFSEREKNQALSLFSKVMIDTAIGQSLDIIKDAPITVARLKTAQYTISGPLRLGAILGGAEGKLLKELDAFGENLGIAFQIKDDILDGEVSLEEAGPQVLEYTDKAKKIIPRITEDSKMRQLLEDMCEYLVERSK